MVGPLRPLITPWILLCAAAIPESSSTIANDAAAKNATLALFLSFMLVLPCSCPMVVLPIRYCSKAKMRFQSLFMLITIQPFDLASL